MLSLAAETTRTADLRSYAAAYNELQIVVTVALGVSVSALVALFVLYQRVRGKELDLHFAFMDLREELANLQAMIVTVQATAKMGPMGPMGPPGQPAPRPLVQMPDGTKIGFYGATPLPIEDPPSPDQLKEAAEDTRRIETELRGES